MKKILLAAAILALAFLAVRQFDRKDNRQAQNPAPAVVSTANNIEEPAPQVAAAQVFRALNGIEVTSEQASQRPVAVMVDNHTNARPQSGLSAADLVYETLAEGGITRFMAVYQQTEVKNIGPIRSARTYYADLADELGALYGHVGGNSDVLAYLKQGQYKNLGNLDEFTDSGLYYRRISNRYPPHNAYSSVAKLRQMAASKKLNTVATSTLWMFKDDPGLYASSSSAQNITINFSLPQFLVKYQYDQKNNQYLRYMGGAAHKDADTGQQIAAKDIAVQFVDIFPVKSDTPLSIGETLTGSGKAYVFEDGKVIAGTWKKGDDNRTRFYDSDDKEISLNPGKIWVEIVPNGRSVSWK